MSIAISAVVRPSPLLRRLQLALALLHLLLSAAVGAGLLGEFHLRPLLAAIVASAGAAFLFAALHPQKPRRVDVCGRGGIRLTVQQGWMRTLSPVCLHGDSTLWPALLVLLLRDDAGAIHVVAVLPDALGRAQFRRLAVALHSLAAVGTVRERTIKIL